MMQGGWLWCRGIPPFDREPGKTGFVVRGAGVKPAPVITVLLCAARVVLAQPVWLCTGQSNMVLGHVSAFTQAQHPDVHAIGRVGTTCWTFAVTLNQATGAEVWVTQAAVEGSSIWQWLAPSAMGDPALHRLLVRRGHWHWGRLFTRYVAPLIDTMEIAGVVQWQGEADGWEPRAYRLLLPGLIRSWRQAWGVEMPFIFVQTPTGHGMNNTDTCIELPRTPPDAGLYGKMRNAYFAGLQEPLTGMVITADLPGGIHPRHRELYGARLAQVALAVAYGWQFPYSGPVYDSMAVDGASIRIRFQANTASGLQPIGGPSIEGFEIAGADRRFVWANAVVDGEDILVSSPAVMVPVAARYAWGADPKWANLFNDSGLVAAPFSTEH